MATFDAKTARKLTQAAQELPRTVQLVQRLTDWKQQSELDSLQARAQATETYVRKQLNRVLRLCIRAAAAGEKETQFTTPNSSADIFVSVPANRAVRQALIKLGFSISSGDDKLRHRISWRTPPVGGYDIFDCLTATQLDWLSSEEG